MVSLPDCPSLLGQFCPTYFLLGGWADLFKPAGVSEQLRGLWGYAPEARSHKPSLAEWRSAHPTEKPPRRSRQGGAGESAVPARLTPQLYSLVKREVISSTELLKNKQEQLIGPGSIHMDKENQTNNNTAMNLHIVLPLSPSLCDKLLEG